MNFINLERDILKRCIVSPRRTTSCI